MDANTLALALLLPFQAPKRTFSVAKPVKITTETVKGNLLSPANIFPCCNTNVTIIEGLLALLMS